MAGNIKHRTLFRRAAIIALAFLLTVPFFLMSATAANVYLIAVNDTLLSAVPAYMPQRALGIMYLPQGVFDGSELGFLQYYVYDRNEFVLYDGTKTLIFSLSSGVAYDYDRQYDQPAYRSGGRVYVPAEFVCGYFGLQYHYWDDLNTVRIVKSARFSMGTFRSLFEEEIKNTLERLSSASPSQGQSSSSPSSSPSPSISRNDVYLAFEGELNEHTASILDTLDEAGVKAAFFVYGEDIPKARDLITRIYCTGHTIGLLGSERGAMTKENMIRQFDEANEQLDDVIFTKTRIVMFPGGSKEFIGEDTSLLDDGLYTSGYRLWDYTSSGNKPGKDAKTQYSFIRNVRQTVTTLRSPGVLRFVSDELTSSSLPGILRDLREDNVPVMQITETIKPINNYNHIK